MGRKLLLTLGALMIAGVLVQPAAAQEAPKAMPGAAAKVQMAPDITGTWMLMSRDLPDGKTVMPPAVTGMLTFTGKYRNFNVMWKDAAGKMMTISYVAEYKLTPTEYTETPLMWVMTNEASPEKVVYTAPPEKGKPNPVSMKDGAMSMPIGGEPPVITFKGDEMTAVAAGQFTDHWKKVGGK